MSKWQIIDTGIQSAEENMRFDAELLENADTYSGPILHFYEWEKETATYGHFIDPADYLDLNKAEQLGLSLARRPTGGGIVFHLWDMAFSVLVPAHCEEFSINTLENYRFVNQAILGAVKEYLEGEPPLSLIPEDAPALDENCTQFCMAKPTKYDVIWGGRKIAGAAQRKTKKGFLHQGTIALVLPPEGYLDQILAPGMRVREAMFAHTCPLLGRTATPPNVAEAKQVLRELLTTHLTGAPIRLGS